MHQQNYVARHLVHNHFSIFRIQQGYRRARLAIYSYHDFFIIR